MFLGREVEVELSHGADPVDSFFCAGFYLDAQPRWETCDMSDDELNTLGELYPDVLEAAWYEYQADRAEFAADCAADR
jgi:hypothetical protein